MYIRKRDDVTKIHSYTAVMHEDYLVPPHPPRTESEGYKAIHEQMVHVEDVPCEVCGLRTSELKDETKNKVGAREIELHHRIVEWAWHTEADQGKVVEDWPQVKGMSRDEFLDWLDHGREALIPLCDVHHRHREIGIHETAGPSFNLVKYLKDDFQLLDDGTIKGSR